MRNGENAVLIKESLWRGMYSCLRKQHLTPEEWCMCVNLMTQISVKLDRSLSCKPLSFSELTRKLYIMSTMFLELLFFLLQAWSSYLFLCHQIFFPHFWRPSFANLFFSVSGTVIPMLEAVLDVVPVEKLAVHFHDTYGQALSNILLSLQVRSLVHYFPLLCLRMLALSGDAIVLRTALSFFTFLFHVLG